MSDAFDAYHVWLGIPPHEQPPNHYRLLGIALFESDPDVVDHAADRQMAHMRTFQSGKHGAQSQKLLNELSAARLCLLNPAKKAMYDGELRARVGAVPKAVPTAPVPRATPMMLPLAKAEAIAAPLKAQPVATPLRAVPVGAAPVGAAPVGKAVPAGIARSARPGDVGPDGRQTVDPVAPLAELLDEDLLSNPPAPSGFQIRRPRRSYGGSWKRAAALGILLGFVTVSFVFLFYFARKLMQNPPDVKQYFSVGPNTETEPVLPPPTEAETQTAPPPPPAPAE